jgi:hypothetical protein
MELSRRSFLLTGSLGAVVGLSTPAAQEAAPAPISPSFPSHDPMLAKEIVGVSHRDVARVRELLSGRPALAKAVWDWGYGDWETALGAASHVGNKEIADVLLTAGAPPTIFSAAMLGQLAVVQAMIAAQPGLQRVKGPHGISLLAHAKAGGSAEVVKYLESLGDADPRYTTEPLSDADRAAILGTYTYGAGPTEKIKVLINTRSWPVIQREGANEQNLFHLGGRVFHTPGNEHLRIRFAAGEPAATVRIEDGSVKVVATRIT